MMNLSIGFVVAEGGAFTTAGFDSYELPVDAAFDRFSDSHRCEPGAPARVDFEPAIDGWAILDAGDTFASRGDSLITSIAVDAATGRHVAVGSESPNLLLGDFFEQRPAIWWSDDRRVWTRADLGGAIGELRDVTALAGGGFVAVGGRPGSPVAWLSADGITWEPFDAPIGADGSLGQFSPVMSAVAVSPDAIVAVGVETYVPTTQALGEDLDAAVWRSTDGRTWDRVTDPSLGTPGFQPNEGVEFNGELSDVVFVSSIGFIAVGSAGPPDPTIDYPAQTPTVWVSTDGTAWERHDIDADARLRGITETATGAVVFGVTDLNGSPTSDAIAFTSTDGATWVPVDGPFGAVEEPDGIQTMNGGLFVPGFGTIVVGSDEAESETRGAASVWLAGEPWTRLMVSPRVVGNIDDTPTFTMTDAAWHDDGFTFVGFSGRQIDLPGGVGTACCIYEPAVWVWQPHP